MILSVRMILSRAYATKTKGSKFSPPLTAVKTIVNFLVAVGVVVCDIYTVARTQERATTRVMPLERG